MDRSPENIKDPILENLAFRLEMAKNNSNTLVLINLAVECLVALITHSNTYEQEVRTIWQALVERAKDEANVFDAIFTGIIATLDSLDERGAKEVEGLTPGSVPSELLDSLSLWTDWTKTIILSLYPELLQKTNRQPGEQEQKLLDAFTQSINSRALKFGVLVRNDDKPTTDEQKTYKDIDILPYRMQLNSKITNILQGAPNKNYKGQETQIINAGAFNVIVANKAKNSKQITALVEYACEQVEGQTKITEQQRMALCAFVTVCQQAENQGIKYPFFIPLSTLQGAMPGGNKKITEQTEAKQVADIEFLSQIRLTVDYTEYYRLKGYIGNSDTYERTEYLLNVDRERRTSDHGGRVSVGYVVNKPPILLELDRKTGQILTLSAQDYRIHRLINGNLSTTTINLTHDRKAIVHYLARRIRTMDAARMTQTILFETIFRECGLENQSPEQRRNNIKFTDDVLAQWVARTKKGEKGLTVQIAGYKIRRKGRAAYAIDIELPAKPNQTAKTPKKT